VAKKRGGRPPASKPVRVGRSALERQYLTAADVAPIVPEEQFVLRQLSRIPVERALEWCARMLAPQVGAAWPQHQREEARAWFSGQSAASEALRLVESGERELVAPQVLLELARLAVLHCCPSVPGAKESQEVLGRYVVGMRSAMLVLAHHTGWRRRLADELRRLPDGRLPLGGVEVTGLERELAANLMLNHRPYAASAFDRSQRRWIELPQEQVGGSNTVDLQAEYAAATGVPLEDVRTIGLVLYAAVLNGNPRTDAGYLDDLGMDRPRRDRALALFSATPTELAATARKAKTASLGAEYDLTLFGERPVVRLGDESLLVVAPQLLLHRTIGWLPYWDLVNGLKALGSGGRRRAAQADTYLRKTTEAHAIETLKHLSSAGRLPGQMYGEQAIQDAFGTKEPNADCAIEWPRAWVVAEISSRTVTQETASGGAGLLQDIELGVVEKARQLDGTIRALRVNEQALTGGRAHGGRRKFLPVLVTTEGFPLHPIITARLRRMVAAAGYLQASDTAPLVVLDVEALEAAEALAERGGPALPKLLQDHARSSMRDYGFREWLILQRGARRAPKRVMQRWDRVFEPILISLLAPDSQESVEDPSG